MKLVRYDVDRGSRTGFLEDDDVFDTTSLVTDPRDLLDPAEQPRIAALVEERRDALPKLKVGQIRLRSPIGQPGKIVCIGLNYSDHAAESGMPPPDEPILFFKAPNAMCGPYDDLLLPPESTKVDWEVELGVVIGRTARYLPQVEDARDVIAGYCVSNDVSERSFQLERGGQWVKGKSCETFQPTGPWLVTADEVPDPQALTLELRVNGVAVQVGSTADMIFGVDHLVWYLSQFMVLEPGDLINTGTPAGVGMGMAPPRFLDAGDVVEASISGLGAQRQTCKPAAISAPAV